jgi:hypothetical protein
LIPIASGVRIWIATGHTDMRRGMNGLAPRGLRVHILYHLWNTAKAVLIRNMSGTPARSCQLAFRNMTRTHVAIFSDTRNNRRSTGKSLGF